MVAPNGWYVPTGQVPQSRSEVADGGVVSYVPGPHSECGVQDPAFSASECSNNPSHASHTRLELTVASCDTYWPGGHVATAAHAPALAVLENVLPSAHCSHTRSAVAEGALMTAVPAAHVFHGVQLVSPPVVENVPGSQGTQVRLAVLSLSAPKTSF